MTNTIPCPACKGTGVIWLPAYMIHAGLKQCGSTCSKCDGKKWIHKEGFTPVYISYIRKLLDRIAELNSIPFDQIIWVDDSYQPLALTPEQIEAFKFTGLANKDFVALEFWKEKVP